ncbi:creatinine amidohydrolase [Microbacterium endophyticum]|uniref:Creatinine amidohydrolase n=1 Tax=Microbacterium endophyticum TaxID=1526412 RepID=A0A7W4V4W5_9MICO|nr:creatininase family protein [Microbacterium endophyticum]MBB2976918.1 creatinine amidohydrolase [Microbacterium endophyticum]NIK35764.1 creatinine amidohydrolase [Microbacterium endophyticum]
MIEYSRSTSTDVGAFLEAEGRVAVMPFGALEQHGPHLPLSTDTLQAEALAATIAERISGALIPAMPYGNTWSNDALPGTVSLSADTVTAVCSDIALSLERAGFDLLVVVNGDFGNRLPLHRAAEAAAARGGMPVLVLDYPGLAEIGDAVKETPWAAPGLCHAEEIETSLVLAIAPELVDRERYVAEYPQLPADFGLRQMALAPLSDSGVFGDPRPASAEKGNRILSHVVEESLHVIAAVRASLSAKKPR